MPPTSEEKDHDGKQLRLAKTSCGAQTVVDTSTSTAWHLSQQRRNSRKDAKERRSSAASAVPPVYRLSRQRRLARKQEEEATPREIREEEEEDALENAATEARAASETLLEAELVREPSVQLVPSVVASAVDLDLAHAVPVGGSTSDDGSEASPRRRKRLLCGGLVVLAVVGAVVIGLFTKPSDCQESGIRKVGMVTLILDDLPTGFLPKKSTFGGLVANRNTTILGDIFQSVYNNVSGMCSGRFARVLVDSSLVDWSYTAFTNGSMISTRWNAVVSCNGCRDEEPLFAGGSGKANDDNGINLLPSFGATMDFIYRFTQQMNQQLQGVDNTKVVVLASINVESGGIDQTFIAPMLATETTPVCSKAGRTKQGRLNLFFRDLPVDFLREDRSVVELLFAHAYNSASGMCNGMFERVFLDSHLLDWREVGSDSSLTTTSWLVRIRCSGCSDAEPLFAGGSKKGQDYDDAHRHSYYEATNEMFYKFIQLFSQRLEEFFEATIVFLTTIDTESGEVDQVFSLLAETYAPSGNPSRFLSGVPSVSPILPPTRSVNPSILPSMAPTSLPPLPPS